MKGICVLQKDGLTIGKSYNILSNNVGKSWLTSDKGHEIIIPTKYFVSIEEYRNIQIDRILDGL